MQFSFKYISYLSSLNDILFDVEINNLLFDNKLFVSSSTFSISFIVVVEDKFFALNNINININLKNLCINKNIPNINLLKFNHNCVDFNWF